MPPLRTYQIPIPDDNIFETRKVAQNLIDQADEDLFCAIGCIRKNPHDHLNETCYLLHQSLEKWIKVAHQMSTGQFKPSHDFGKDLLPVFCDGNIVNNNSDKADKPDLHLVFDVLEQASVVMEKNYPDRVRYREHEKHNYNLNIQLAILLDAVFLARRLIKHWLKDKIKKEVN